MNPTIVRAYQYLVALVAIHMVVLGAANALRVVAELALGAPSGGFMGLPFLFAEGRAAPLEIHREQVSLAIALLLVGIPAWFLHWRAADRAARRSDVDRSSEWRSFYLHAVMAVTALLALGYAARALSLLSRIALFGSERVGPFGLESQWPAEAAGAAAMTVVAAATWWWHALRSEEDRRAGVGTRAAEIRRFQTYAVVFIVTLVAAVSAVFLVTGIWNATVGFIDFSDRPFPVQLPPGAAAPPLPDRARLLKEALAGTLPSLGLAIVLGTLYVRRARRVARLPGSDGVAERASSARAVFLYMMLFLAGIGALVALAILGQTLLSRFDSRVASFPLGPSLGASVPPALVLAALWLLAWRTAGREVRRSAGAPGPADTRRVYLYVSLAVAQAVALVAAGFTLQRLLRPLLGGPSIAIQDVSTPVPFLVLFTVAWLYHEVVVRRERSAPETAPQADARRLFSYFFYLAGVAAAAIGLAGAVGVIGSYVLADNTHRPDEIALYLTLSALGLLTAWFQRSLVRGTLDSGERAAPQRRVALSLAVLGGAGAVLVFGSGAVFRIVNAILAVEFTTSATHDLWHLLADTGVGLVVALYHWRILRADRALAAPATAPAPLVLILPRPIGGMRQRLIARFSDEGGQVFETDADSLRDIVRRLEPTPSGSKTTEVGPAGREPTPSLDLVEGLASRDLTSGSSGSPSTVAREPGR